MRKIKALVHTVSGLERWDTLAWRYYGDPFAYGRIIEANPAIDITAVLPSGAKVLIPILSSAEISEQRATTNLPPWKR